MSSVGYRWGLCGVIFSVAVGGCAASSSVEEEVGEVGQHWSVSYCATARADFTIGGYSGGSGNPAAMDPEYITSRTYDTCYKAFVIDIHNLKAAYTGPGGNGGPPARLRAAWADTTATNQAACEDHGGGIIVYKKVGANWVDQTGQLGDSGVWHPAGFFAAYCEEPLLEFTDLVAGASYRIAATMRIDSTATTRKIQIQNLKEEVLH